AVGGFDCELGVWRDMRGYLFPDHNAYNIENGILPLVPNKADAWAYGFISQYVGLREFGRYVKYHDYGYDMRLVKNQLVAGYWGAAAYLTERTDHKYKVQLRMIFENTAMLLETDSFDKLRAAALEITFEDDLDAIMDSLS